MCDWGTFDVRFWRRAGLLAALAIVLVRADAVADGTPSPICDRSITFFAPKQLCKAWWFPDGTGMPATLSFIPADPKIVTVQGIPVTLPAGYTGPFPPAAQYVANFVAGKKAGTTTVQVLATHPDGSSQFYNTWTITNAFGCGDERDSLIEEYKTFGVRFRPACANFTQTASTANYAFLDLNTGDYGWAILTSPLVGPASQGYGLDAWISFIGSVHHANSAYRNPARNAAVGGATNSRHMHGDAIDLQNVSQRKKEYSRMKAAAILALADYIEPLKGPCKLLCVHSDWRNHPGAL